MEKETNKTNKMKILIFTIINVHKILLHTRTSKRAALLFVLLSNLIQLPAAISPPSCPFYPKNSNYATTFVLRNKLISSNQDPHS